MFVLLECIWLHLPTLSCLCKSQTTPRSSSSRLVLGDRQSISLSSTPPLHLLLFLLHLRLLLLFLSTPLSSCLLPHLRLHHPPSTDLLSLQASRLQLHPLSPPPPPPPSLLLLSPRESRSSTAGRVLPLPSPRLHQPEPQVLRLSPTWSQPPREQVCTTVPLLKTLLKHFQRQPQAATFYTDSYHILWHNRFDVTRAVRLLIWISWVRFNCSWAHVGAVLSSRHAGFLPHCIIGWLCSPSVTWIWQKHSSII